MNSPKVSCLVNTSYVIKTPADKNNLPETFRSHRNYTPIEITPQRMIKGNVSGYQVIPGKFEHNEDRKIRLKGCLKELQMFTVEMDDNVKENSLQEVLDNDLFTKQNAFALTESVRSKYDDPEDKGCNGELRYRIWFLMPKPSSDLEQIEWVKRQILKRYPDADPGGSTLTSGAYGREGAEYIILDNYISQSYLNFLARQWKMYLSRPKPVMNFEIEMLPIHVSQMIQGMKFGKDGWSIDRIQCPFSDHQHDHIRPATVAKKNDDGSVLLLCHKCKERKLYKVEA